MWRIAVPQSASQIQLADYLTFERPTAEPQRQSEAMQMAVARGISALIARGKTS